MIAGRRVKVWRAHAEPGAAGAAPPGALTKTGALGTADGQLVLDEVQPEGKRAMTGAAFVAGVAPDARRLGAR
jgi:methionyl-tRNA formyltransferase